MSLSPYLRQLPLRQRSQTYSQQSKLPLLNIFRTMTHSNVVSNLRNSKAGITVNCNVHAHIWQTMCTLFFVMY